MTQKDLLSTAASVTLIVGVVLFVGASQPTLAAAKKKASPTPKVSPSVSVSPSATPCIDPTPSPATSPTVSPTVSPKISPSTSPKISPTPSPSPSTSPTATPCPTPTESPEFTYEPADNMVRVWQTYWNKAVPDHQPLAVTGKKYQKRTRNIPDETGPFEEVLGTAGTLAGAYYGGTYAGNAFGTAGTHSTVTGTCVPISSSSNFVNNCTNSNLAAGVAGGAVGALAGNFIGSTVGGALDGIFGLTDSQPVPSCFRVKYQTPYEYIYQNYAAKKNVRLPNDGNSAEGMTANIDENYIISNTYTTAKGDSAEWLQLAMIYTKASKGAVKVFYRISDSGGTIDPADAKWVQAPDPVTKQMSCNSKVSRATYDINKTGKYFQYMFKLAKAQRVQAMFVDVQPLKKTGVKPGTETSPTPTPSPTPTTAGRITVISKKLVLQPSPTPTSHALLPSIAPTPSPSSSPNSKAPSKPNPDCFSNDNTDAAANVPISFRQQDGTVKVEDQQTDADGVWQGIDGNQDTFPVGTYVMKLGDYQKDDYKLVDICVQPNDGTFVRKTETGAGSRQATINVKQDQETQVVLLYGLRNKPYITMNMFAIASNNKVLRAIFPGLNFRYLVRYENTGDVMAKSVTIANVLPEQYYIPGSDTQDIETTNKLKVSIDAIGRTTIAKLIGDLKPGQKGSFAIPVILKADAFGSVADIGAQVDAIRQAVTGGGGAGNGGTAAPAGDQTSSANAPGDLQLK